MTHIEISEAVSDAQFNEGKILIDEYADYLDKNRIPDPIDFDEDIDSYPEHYLPPTGAVLVAKVDGELAGCVSLRQFEGSICEMKRLFVRENYRRLKLGKTLAVKIIERAIELGFDRMRLDTLPEMTAAVGLYESLGFQKIEAYFDTDVEDTIFMELDLESFRA